MIKGRRDQDSCCALQAAPILPPPPIPNAQSNAPNQQQQQQSQQMATHICTCKSGKLESPLLIAQNKSENLL